MRPATDNGSANQRRVFDSLIGRNVCLRLAGVDHLRYQWALFAPAGMEGPKRVVGLFALCFDIIRTGFHPDRLEPLAWYDRAIRIVGGILILAVFGTGLVLLILERFKK